MRRRMPTRVSPWFAVLLVLCAIGAVSAAVVNPLELVGPVILVAAVLLLYRFPPDRWARTFRRHLPHENPRNRQRTPVRPLPPDKRQRKVIPFRVIEGKKKREDRSSRDH